MEVFRDVSVSCKMPLTHCECSVCFAQDTIEALMRAPDVIKSLRDNLRKVKDASRLLTRLMVCSSSIAVHCNAMRNMHSSTSEGPACTPDLLQVLLSCKYLCKLDGALSSSSSTVV